MPRGNPQNLKPNVGTKEERRERSRKAGIASGKARQARKTLREELLALLSAGKTQTDMNLALIARALNGDVKAYEVVRDTIGEKPVEKVMVADVDPDVMREVEEAVLKGEKKDD